MTQSDTKKILFLVDHKHRDLPSLALMAYFLNHMNWHAKLAALGNYDEIIETFDPQVIVLPKPNHDFEKMMTWRLSGRKIVIIDSEGNHQDKNFVYKVRVMPNVYLFWNNKTKSRYLDLEKKYDTHLKTLGFYRSDFLSNSFHNLYDSREKILRELSLEPQNKTITIATASQDTHLSEERREMKAKRRKSSIEGTSDYFDLIDNDLIIRKIKEKVIKSISEKYSDVNVIIKPHPNENVVYWSEFIDNLNCENIKLFVGRSINPLLSTSDLHISKNCCTTTIESRLHGINSIEIHTNNSEIYFSRDHFLSDYIAYSAEDTLKIIDLLITGASKDRLKEYTNEPDINEYIKKYLHKFDGERCFSYAKHIDFLFTEQEVRMRAINFRRFFHDLKNYLLLLIVFIRNRMSRRIIDQRYLTSEVNKVTSENLRDTTEIEGSYVDKEYGLFDNRMKQGDEESWYKKFKTNQHIQDLIRSL